MQPPRTGEYFISPKELSPSWLLLYLATFALQVPCAAIRGFVAYPVIWLLFKLLGQPTTLVHLIALVIGYGPLAISLATLVLPLGSWWWEQQAGGRSPSEREQLVYQDALAQLRNADPGLREPRRWFVLDEEIENAGAYADTLMVTRGLLDSGYLRARPRTRARTPQHQRRKTHRSPLPDHNPTPRPSPPRPENNLFPRYRRYRDVATARSMGCLLAQPRAPRRPLRRTPRPSQQPRRVPRRAQSTDRPTRPVHLAQRAQPPPNRAPRRAPHPRRHAPPHQTVQNPPEP